MIAHRQQTPASQPAISHLNSHMQPASHNQQMIASHGHHPHHHHLSQQPGLPVHQQQQPPPPPPPLNPQMHHQQEQYYVQSAGDLPASQYQHRVTSINNPSADHHQLSTSTYNDHHHSQQLGASEGQPLEAIGQQGQRFRHQQAASYSVGQHQQSQHQQYQHQHHNHQQASSQPVVIEHQVPQHLPSYQRQQQQYELMPQSTHQAQQSYGQQPQDAQMMHAQQQQQHIMHHQQPQARPLANNPRLGPQPPMMTQRISPYQSQQQPPVRQQQQTPAVAPSHHRHQQPASNQLVGPPTHHHHNQQQYSKPHPQPQQQMIVRDSQIQGHSIMQSQSNSNNNVNNQLANHQPISGPFPPQQLSQHHPSHNLNNHHHQQKSGYFINDNGPPASGAATSTNQVMYASDHNQHHNAQQPNEQQRYLSNSPTLLQQQLNRQPSGQQAPVVQRLGGARLHGSPPTGPSPNYPSPGQHQANLIGPPMPKTRGGNGRFLPSGEHPIEPSIAEPTPHHTSQVQPAGYRPAGVQPQVVAARGDYYPTNSAPGPAMGPVVRAPMHRVRPPAPMQDPLNQPHHQMVGQHPQHLLSNPTPPLTPNPNNPASQHHLVGGPPPLPMGPRTINNPALSTQQIVHHGNNSLPNMGPNADHATQSGGQQSQW